MFGAIYKITFPNNKVYVGRTRLTSIHEVIVRYRCEMMNSSRPVNLALNKYGINNCVFEFIYQDSNASEEILNNTEIHLIKENYSMIFENGYNVTSGGESQAVYGKNNGRYLHISDDVVDLINEMRSKGCSLSKITRDLNLPNRDIVKRRLLPHLKNLKTSEKFENKGTWKNIDKNKLIELFNQKFSIRSIANHFNVSSSVIRKRIDYWKLIPTHS